MIFHFGFGERRALDHRPHDRLGTAIKLAGLGDFQQFAGNAGFGMVGHGRVGMIEVALDAETAEFGRLHVDPALREFAAFAAEFVDLHLVLVLALLAVLFLDLPFDRQAVAIPARNIVGVASAHLERAGDDVFQDLVQRVADMDVAVGVGRAVMQHELLAPPGVFAQLLVEAHFLPAGHGLRLLLGQAGAHRKLCLRQVEGGGIVFLFRNVGHGLANQWGAGHPAARKTECVKT